MSKTRQEKSEELLQAACHALRSYQYGNAAPDLAEGMADKIQEFLESEEEA